MAGSRSGEASAGKNAGDEKAPRTGRPRCPGYGDIRL